MSQKSSKSNYRRADLISLGAAFADLRRSRGFSQRALAERSGIAQSAISRFEAAKAPGMSVRALAILLNALGAFRPSQSGLEERPFDWLIVRIKDPPYDGDALDP